MIQVIASYQYWTLTLALTPPIYASLLRRYKLHHGVFKEQLTCVVDLVCTEDIFFRWSQQL